MNYHFARDNADLTAFLELIRGQRGDPPEIFEPRCDICGKLMAIAWADEMGWNYIAFNEQGRKLREKITRHCCP